MVAESNEPVLDQDALREIVAGTASETGEAFFDELVKHLARAMGTKCAWVTEWLEDKRRLRALSFWVEDRYFGDYEYDIVHTPCEPVINDRKLIHVPDRVLELYAGDPDLRPLGAVSYMGVPLFDTDGSILGHLAVLHTDPLPENPRVTGVFNIFAARAAAELRRVRRDRDLREREQKLRRLIESAMDGIVELDDQLVITNMNRAGEKMFGCAASETTGRPFGGFLTSTSRGKLSYLTAALERQPEERQSLWIPDGLKVVRADGTGFTGEATISRFELAGRAFFTLILRDVDERLQAEARIRSLMSETAYLRAEIEAMHGFDDIIGESESLRRALSDVDKVSASDTTVLIAGETGTGKELIARAIHQRSPRAGKPLIKVNCAAIAATLQESEFFGHEKGAFTGATQRRDGRFKLSDGGTIFLDEVGEMPLELQAKLLRVLQEGEFEPVGSSRTERVDVRLIAATNRDLEQMVKEGTFRRDLLYRLNVFPVHVPPLRERGADVVLLAEAFARSFAKNRGVSVSPLTADDKARLRRYDWPGNVRELQNVIERALITSKDGRSLNLSRALPESTTHASDERLGASTTRSDGPGRVLTATEMQALERDNIERALAVAGGKISGTGGAAELLGLHPNTLSSRMKTLGLKRPQRG
ncbi:MAG: sigma 54-interacting transcriptional regulator [Acidobacteriota bacterium]|nr:MAG: sigma 54-interacting transcriptional regulator [Acidobacteriota bacterium]